MDTLVTYLSRERQRNLVEREEAERTMTHLDSNPATKSTTSDVAAVFEEFQRTFEAYKEGDHSRVSGGVADFDAIKLMKFAGV
jgi:predicted phage gp36 major capsid-like protein